MHESLLALSAWLIRYLTHAATAACALGFAAWLADWPLRRIGPAARHRLWVGTLFVSVALPLFPGRLFSILHRGGSLAAGRVTIFAGSATTSATGRWTLSSSHALLLAGLYLFAATVRLAQLAWRWRRSSAMVRRAAPCEMPSGVALVRRTAYRLWTKPPELRSSPEASGPLVSGIWRPVLVVPESFFEHASPEDAAAALAHESAHMQRQDFARNLLYEVVAVALPYHPACWLMRRRIAQTRELICDEMAAATAPSRLAYAASLLRLATEIADAHSHRAIPTTAIGVFDANILEERIMRLTEDIPAVSRIRQIATLILATAAVTGSGAAAMTVPLDITPQSEASAQPEQTKVYHVGKDVSAPVLIHSIDPVYPKEGRLENGSHRITAVICQLVVDSSGHPQQVEVLRSGGAGFDRNAIEAIRQYRFRPGTRAGKPVAVSLNIETTFNLY